MQEQELNVGEWGLRVLGAGAGVGLLLSSVELLAFLFGSGFRHAPRELAWPSALTALVVLAAYLVCALLLGLLWRLIKGSWSSAPNAGLAVFLVCLFLGLGLTLRHGETLESLLTKRKLIALTLGVGSVLAIAVMVYAPRAKPGKSLWLELGLAAPLLVSFAGLALFAFKRSSMLLGLALGVAALAVVVHPLLLGRSAAPRSRALLNGLLLALLVLGAQLVRPGPAPAPPAAQPWGEGPIRNVILISIDTLRPSSLSCYGSSTQTPAIDQLASDGVRFERAISPAPWTLPALSSIMTGVTPAVHGAVARNGLLPGALPTMAELIREEGYVTGAIGSNHLLTRGFSRGFHTSSFFPIRPLHESLGYRAFDDSEPATTETLTDLSIDWVEAHADEPFFLWLHYFDPHSPYAPPAEYQPEGEAPPRIGRSVGPALFTALRTTLTPTPEERDWVMALYDGEVRYVDANLARLLAKLKELELYEDALIVLTSDHGEEFWEHESLGHGHNLFDESLRVPLIIKLPASSTKQVVGETISTRRILSTLLELCRIDAQELEHQPDSLSSTWGQPGAGMEAEALPVISSGMLYGEDKVSLTGDRAKYILGRESRREWFFDLGSDPGELYPVAPEALSLSAALRSSLEQFDLAARVLRARLGAEDAHVESVDTDALKALGYL